ncbi:MAG: hypothetical protein QOE33_307 [Acidobacteriota bacterium]|nr:hypothetical protein [Acidobacteriota bacterium]
MKSILMKLPAAFVLCASLFAVGTSAAAPQNIDRREQRQQRRIRQGVRSGELTRREARGLERRETRVNRAEWRARRSGGTLTGRERGRLNRELNRSSRAVYRQKHDRQENERRENRRGRRHDRR